MSIIIRKECQPLLDSLNLNDLHVDILDKTLSIVGPCGQPLLHISGIRFDANAPKKVEISYAVDLFSKFLDTHSKLLLDFVQAKRDFNSLSEPEYTGTLGTSEGYPRDRIKFFYPGTQDTAFTITDNGTVNLQTRLSETFTLEDLVDYVKRAEEDIAPYVAESKAYKSAQIQLSHLISCLNKCDI